MSEKRNLTMMTDLYQLTMMYGYFRNHMAQNQSSTRKRADRVILHERAQRCPRAIRLRAYSRAFVH